MFPQAYTCTLSSEMLKKAQAELKEDPSTRHLEIKTLRERLEQLPGYRGRTDDGFLLRFLRCKKFVQEKAFEQVKTYYQVRKDNPDVFDNLTPKRVQNILESNYYGMLKDRAPDGSRMVYLKPGNWDPDKSSFADVLGHDFLFYSKLIEDEETQVCGVSIIADMKNFSWNQGRHYTPSHVRKMVTIYQEAMPIRIKRVHHINEPTIFDVVFSICKPFLKEKLLKRIYFHGDQLEKLYEVIPREILPADLGGTVPPHSYQEFMDELLSCEQQFMEENKFGLVDMTIPAKGQKKADATEALGGTFRKLNVD